MGWLGYAKGSEVGNIMAERSGTLWEVRSAKPDCVLRGMSAVVDGVWGVIIALLVLLCSLES